MPQFVEFRIPLPIDVDEYFIAQLFSVAEESKNQTGGGEGVSVMNNEPFNNERGTGQYTYKVYKLDKKVPQIIKAFAPKGSLTFHEYAWNSYPNCYTEYTNEAYGEKFQLIIKSKHLADGGTAENAFDLSEEERKNLRIITINIADSKSLPKDKCSPEFDPTVVKSEKVDTLPLVPNFAESHKPIMCCYKLYLIKCGLPLIGRIVENHIRDSVQVFLHDFHRKLICWIDKWKGLTIENIREIEEKTKEELEKKIDEDDSKKSHHS